MSSDAFNQIMTGLDEALAHARGEDVPGLVVHVPERIDVAAIRERTGLSQSAASRISGTSPKGALGGSEPLSAPRHTET